MGSYGSKLLAWLSIALVWFSPVQAFAEERFLTAIMPNAQPRPVSILTMTKPAHWDDGQAFYAEYFAPLDHRIRRESSDRWYDPNWQNGLAMQGWNYEKMSWGTPDFYDRDNLEARARADYARRVLWLRMDSALRTFLAPEQRATQIRSAHIALNRLRDMPVPLSADGTQGELRFGYDILSDSSKLEYVKGSLNAGLYTPHLISALSGSASLSWTHLRLSSSLGIGMPRAAFSYQLASGMLDATLTQTLNRSWTMELSTTQPLHAGTLVPSFFTRFYFSF